MPLPKVPEGRTARNRVHLDLTCADREAEVERPLGLGAKRVDDEDEWGITWTTLFVPEGNECCVGDDRWPSARWPAAAKDRAVTRCRARCEVRTLHGVPIPQNKERHDR